MGGGDNYPIPRDAPPEYTSLPPVIPAHDNAAIHRNTYEVSQEVARAYVPVDRDDGNKNNNGCTGCTNCEFIFLRVWRWWKCADLDRSEL
jgi:hypothetical protein